ncbi:replication-associated recombination protein A [Thermonema rossianum]|uniref:replication-associated recombination protein A n=1 Tax=Thermonema rossianum TaxID=55505 RepID=UPI000570E38B|nr:replication-associated recombination protein A [Thermonema rossianum]
MPPLAERMRPKNLSDFVGQSHLIGEKGSLQKLIDCKLLPSMILWGPPGTGKTTLARLLANQCGLPFQSLSALEAGVKEIRQQIEQAARRGTTVLFIDEIHRFNKAQQDALLKAVEEGSIKLIGATTENPGFSVNNALLSRCQVYALSPLSEQDLLQIARRAIARDPLLQRHEVQLKETEALLRMAQGDARRLLNLLEQCIESLKEESPIVITNEVVQSIAQQQVPLYDKNGEMHYGLISAFIKSMRGSDPNAALYYMARMLQGGEDPLFIARRMLIFASEDVGNANPQALILANSTLQAVQQTGMPEARIILAQCATYLASSPKSNASYVAINQAMQAASETAQLPVPLHLRNAPTHLMKSMGYGEGYEYPHDAPNHFVKKHYLPDALRGRIFYRPGEQGKEKNILERLKALWKGIYPYDKH